MTPTRSLNLTLSCLIALALVFGTLGFGTLGSGTAHALTAPVIKTPKEDDQFTNADIPVEWSPVSWAGFYQVIVVDDATNETAVYAYDIGNVTRYLIPKSSLRGNRYYRIIVLAFPPGGGSGAGSGWVRIWNNSAVTQRPVITKPAANDQLYSDQLTFAWNAVPGAVIYHLIITDAKTGEQVHFAPSLTVTTVDLPAGTLPAGRKYHVKVAAMDSATNGSGMMS
ncbi:MAG TPA: hypothetical protein VK464_07165, partial [Symbiobacteriaceae bacterium]|nr:hypothetical protein [Symbiobacteriaceae bacterium]